MVLNMTHGGKHCRLHDLIQKGAKPLLCDVEYDSERQTLPSSMMISMTQRGKHSHFVWSWGWYRDKHCRIVLWRWLCLREAKSAIACDVLNMKQRGKECRLVLCWIRRRGKITMEVGEEMMRGMPQHEWRHKVEKKKLEGFFSEFCFLSWWAFVRWAFVPCPAKYIQRKNWLIFNLDKNPNFFFSFSDSVSPRSFSPCMITL